MKILVVGAGIAGSCMATVLREAGHDVVLTDPAPESGASRCAFALTRLAWHHRSARARVQRSLDWYGSHGWIITWSATVHDVRRGWTAVQEDHCLIDPAGPLVPPDLPAALEWLESRDGRVLAGLGVDMHRFGAVVLAAGPGTAGLAPSALGPGALSYGGIFTAPGNRLTDDGPLALLRRTDRLSYTAAYIGSVFGGQTRIGASRSRTPEQARRSAEDIRNRLLSEGVVTGPADDWTYRSGIRYATPLPGASRLAPRIWALTGLARSGYALAPAAALDIATEIGELRS